MSLVYIIFFVITIFVANASCPIPNGKCRYIYNGGGSGPMIFGKNFKVHHFICCNNCEEEPQKQQQVDNSKGLQHLAQGSKVRDSKNKATCDKHTYHTGSEVQYCDHCGVDWSNGSCAEIFECGGCEGQDRIEQLCREKWSISLIPLFCWIFSTCMKNRCKQEFPGKKERILHTILLGGDSWCGDGTCNRHETVENCPLDCCPSVNDVCRVSATSRCLPTCCNEPTCCKDTSSPEC